MSILKHKNSKIIDLTKPVEIKTYLAISVLGKSLNLNINYKKNKCTRIRHRGKRNKHLLASKI